MNWTEFFEMGGYAFYVWSAWGATALVILWQIVHAKYVKKKLLRELRRQIRREQKHMNDS